MHALLSLCNEQRSPEKGVLLFDFGTKTATWVPVGTEAEIMGTRGICRHAGFLYVLYTVGWWETHLSIYGLAGETPVLLGDRLLPEIADPHSVCVHDERLLIASTGTDEIVAYDLGGGELDDVAETFWRATRTGRDTHHVNSVSSDGRRVVISAFGPRAGEFWSTAEDGYIYDVTAGKRLSSGLRHPHSVRLHGDAVYFTESSRQSVQALGAQPIIVGGYVRGCDVVDESSILVGSNVARRVSRSRGVVTNSSNWENTEGEVVGKCSVAHVRMRSVPTREFYDITPFGAEIYDICVLE